MIISQGSQAAVEADEIVEAIKAETERQRREKQADTQRVTMKQPITQLIAPSKVRKEDNETRTKLATTFNTNRTYINEAARLKQGREKKKEEGKLYGRGNTKDEKVLSIIDTTFEEETHSTRKIIAEEIGKSTAPTLATIGRMPGRLQNKMMVGQ